MTFDSDLVAETFPDMNIDLAPMDESWFVSQEFYFDEWHNTAIAEEEL